MIRIVLLAVAVFGVFSEASLSGAEVPLNDVPAEVWVLDPAPLSREEQTLAAVAQGVLNREVPRVWIKSTGVQDLEFAELVEAGTRIERVRSPWELVEAFRDKFSGAVLYEPKQESLNVATTVCGLRGAIPITEAMKSRAAMHGLKVIEDVRDMSLDEAVKRWGGECSDSIVVHQPAEKHYHLRDFAAAKRAFVFATTDRAHRVDLLRRIGKAPIVYGWGEDERDFVEDASLAGGAIVPADWALNLSFLQHLNAEPIARQSQEFKPAEAGERVVAFVMTDGDNVQWTAGRFGTHPGFWGSPHRGKFAMTWEMAPLLKEVAPTVLARYHRESREGQNADSLIAGPSGVAYYFPHDSPNPDHWTERTAESMQASGMSISTVLNRGGDMSEADALLDDPRVDAVFYKDYAPYNKKQGAVRWHNGKPCIAYRYLLWEPREDQMPAGVAEAIATLPARADSDPNSFALVNVHAWSFRDMGGPMEAIKQTIDALPANTRVVNADEYVHLLKAACQRSQTRSKIE
ncbi:hypothetical protein [Aeoliella sp. SH292]|uniref:hypothetical protein n=1 Tax=Aeoliella sp. SH292 TaxID=3454464 RepID=UPI003F9851DD